MKQTTIQLRYDAEKYDALRVALKLKGTTLEAEMLTTVDAMFDKIVHKAVRDYLLLKSSAEK